MAIKEFEIGPQNYFEEDYFSGDYTESNVSRSFLECDIDNIRGGRVVTGEYYEDNYIDGTYFHNNSMGFQMVVEAMVVQEATVIASNYFQDSYYEAGYYQDSGSRFTLVLQIGETVDAVGSIQGNFSAESVVTKILSAQTDVESSFTQQADVERIRGSIGNNIDTNNFIVFESTSTTVVTAGTIKQANATINSEFQQTATISHIEGADLFAFSESQMQALIARSRDYAASLDDVFDVATDYIRFRTGSATADAEFAQSAEGARSRDFDTSVEAAVSLDISAGSIKGADVSMSASGAVLAAAGELIDLGTNVGGEEPVNLQASFVLSAAAQIPTRIVDFEVFEEPYYDELLFSTDRKFGTTSLRLDGVQGETLPLSKPLWNGSNYKLFANGFTWTSSDAVNWTRTSNNLSADGIVTTDYLNNLYIVKNFSGEISYSSDGTTWTKVTIAITNFTVQSGDITYASGYWYIVARQNTSSYGLRVYRNTSIQATGWTGITSSTGSTTFDSLGFCRGVKRYGTSLVIASDKDPFLGATNRNITITRFTPSNTFTGGAVVSLGSQSTEFFSDFAYDGTDYYIVTTDGSTRKLRKNSLSTPTATWSNYVVRINYVGDRYVTSRETLNQTVTGTHFSANGFDVVSAPTIPEVITNPTFQNNKFFAKNNLDYSGYRLVLTTSDDGINFNGIDIDTIEGVNSSRIEYRSENLANWKTVDFWTKTNNLDFANAFAKPLSIGNADIQTYEASNVRYFGINDSFTFGPLTGVNYSNWTHIRLLRNGTTIKAYINGVSRGTTTFTFTDNTFKVMSGENSGSYDIQVDEFLVSSEFLNPFNDESFAVPTQPYTNNDSTLLLLHFDNDYADDAEPPFEAVLSSSSNLSATVGIIADAQVDFESIASNLTAINVIGNTLVDFASVASIVDASAQRTRAFDSSISSQAELSTQANLLKDPTSTTLSAEFALSAQTGFAQFIEFDDSAFASLSADAVVIRSADIDASVEFAFEAAVGTIPLAQVNLNAEFNTSIAASAIRPFDSAMNLNTALSVDAIKAVEAEGAFSSEFTSTAINSRTRDFDTDFESIAINLIAASKIGDFFINAESNFVINATAVKLVAESAQFENAIALDVAVEVTRTTASDIQSSTQLIATGRLSSEAASDVSVIATAEIIAVKTAKGEAEVASAMTFDTTVVATRNNEIQTFTTSTLDAQANVIRGVQAQISTQADIASSAERIRTAQSTAESSVSLTAQGRKVVFLEELEHTIKREFREYVIPRESRAYTIKQEIREHTIQGA